jgi:hypothetical protein
VASGEVAASDTSATAELLRQLGPGSAAVTTEITTQLTNVAEKVRVTLDCDYFNLITQICEPVRTDTSHVSFAVLVSN